MTRALLDVNVLLALLDSDHVDHHRAHDWLDDEIAAGWASCAITENGFVRIISQPRYPSPVSPSEAIELLSRARDGGHHAFWPCDVSVLDARIVDPRLPAWSASGDRRLPARPGGGPRRTLRHLRPLPVPRFGARRQRGPYDDPLVAADTPHLAVRLERRPGLPPHRAVEHGGRVGRGVVAPPGDMAVRAHEHEPPLVALADGGSVARSTRSGIPRRAAAATRASAPAAPAQVTSSTKHRPNRSSVERPSGSQAGGARLPGHDDCTTCRGSSGGSGLRRGCAAASRRSGSPGGRRRC